MKDKIDNRDIAKLYILSDAKKLRRNINIKYFAIRDIVLIGGVFVFFNANTENKINIDIQKRLNRKLVSGILKKLAELLYIFINSLKSNANKTCEMFDCGGPRIESNKIANDIENRNAFLLRNNDIIKCTI